MSASNEAAKVGVSSHPPRSVTYCAVCGELETMHEIRADGSRGKRFGAGQAVKSVSTPGVACPGFVPGRTEERQPEDELRRRLAAVLALPLRDASLPTGLDAGLDPMAYGTGYFDGIARAHAVARGES